MFRFAFVAHAQLVHHVKGRAVGPLRNRNDSVQPNAVEGIVQGCAPGLRSIALPPSCLRQPPSDFDFRSSIQRLQAAEADHFSVGFIFELPKAIPARGKACDLPFDELAHAFIPPRLAARDIAHYFGILRDRAQ